MSRVRGVACPVCRAPANSSCRTRGGRARKAHDARRQAAERAYIETTAQRDLAAIRARDTASATQDDLRAAFLAREQDRRLKQPRPSSSP